MRLLRSAVFLLVIVGLAWLALVVALYRTVPSSDTAATHFDAIIVLGTPSLLDGTPSPEQRERVLEGVREFRAGVAPHLIMTGGPAHNHFIEAHTMALYAESLGVPAEEVVEEGQAQNTLQNIFYSRLLMQQHGWNSAEVVSSPSHLPRTALILEHYRFPWRTQVSRWPPEYGLVNIGMHYWAEAGYCFKLRVFGFPASRFLQGDTTLTH